MAAVWLITRLKEARMSSIVSLSVTASAEKCASGFSPKAWIRWERAFHRTLVGIEVVDKRGGSVMLCGEADSGRTGCDVRCGGVAGPEEAVATCGRVHGGHV